MKTGCVAIAMERGAHWFVSRVGSVCGKIRRKMKTRSALRAPRFRSRNVQSKGPFSVYFSWCVRCVRTVRWLFVALAVLFDLAVLFVVVGVALGASLALDDGGALGAGVALDLFLDAFLERRALLPL